MSCRYQQEATEQSAIMVEALSKPAVDIWIGRVLKRAYDPALSDPLPAELLRLLDSFPSRR